jgi:hypothetical protein
MCSLLLSLLRDVHLLTVVAVLLAIRNVMSGRPHEKMRLTVQAREHADPDAPEGNTRFGAFLLPKGCEQP